MNSNSAVRAADLRHRITILQSSKTTDAAGAAVSWAPIFENVPAAISPFRATDIIRSGQTISEVTVPITIRYLPGVKPNMRVQHDADTYIIQGLIDPDRQRRKLVLMCLALAQSM